MAQRVVLEGFQADGPVATLAEFGEVLRKWVPSLTPDDASRLLVRPPFDLGRQFSDGEGEAAAAQLRSLGARVRLEPVDDPTWWRDRHGETAFSQTVPDFAAAMPAPSKPLAPPRAAALREPGLWETFSEVLFRPSAFFASAQVRDGGFGNPLLFAVLFSVLGAVLAAPGNYVVGSMLPQGETSLRAELAAAVLGTPLMAIIGISIYAVVLHIIAKVFGGEGDFGVAWRIAAYSAAANVFQALPGVGFGVILFLYFIYSIAGLQGGYRLTPARAAAAALMPAFFLAMMFFLVLVALAVFFAGVAGLGELFELMQSNSIQGF